MGLQAFAVRQVRRDRAQHLRARLADLDQAGLRFWKSYTPSGELKRAVPRGRQHVVRTGTVVAQALAGEGAQEDRAGVAQQRLPAVRARGC